MKAGFDEVERRRPAGWLCGVPPRAGERAGSRMAGSREMHASRENTQARTPAGQPARRQRSACEIRFSVFGRMKEEG